MLKKIDKLKIIGHINASNLEILSKYESGEIDSLSRYEGSYILIFSHANDVEIISSSLGISQYFYTIKSGCFFHAETVIDVIRQAQITDNFNYTALENILFLDHVLDNETLHQEVFRVPPACILKFSHGTLDISPIGIPQVNNQFTRSHNASSSEDALDIFNSDVCYWSKNLKPVVSISGGLDSRLILSAFLKLGISPRLIVTGSEDSSDVVISKKIAQHFSLDLEIIPLSVDDYIENASKIVELTGGTKFANHWHTYIYPKKSKLANQDLPIFIGANGEYARLFFIDQVISKIGRFSNFLDIKNYSYSFLLWLSKYSAYFSHKKILGTSPAQNESLVYERRIRSVLMRLHQLVTLSHQNAVSGMDRFYVEQRVRNFISNGLLLYDQSFSWRSPFLNLDWMRVVDCLPISWRSNSRWHRYAIAQNCPELAEIPYEKDCLVQKPYFDYADLATDKRILSFIRDNYNLISDLVSKSELDIWIDEPSGQRERIREVSALLTIVHWKKLVRDNSQ